jgi:hypothetical protein
MRTQGVGLLNPLLIRVLFSDEYVARKAQNLIGFLNLFTDLDRQQIQESIQGLSRRYACGFERHFLCAIPIA